MKRISVIAAIMMLCLLLTACAQSGTPKTEYFGFVITDYTVVEQVDTHGGFHGDGAYRLILDCSANASQAREIVKDWTPLPLSENLELIMYGGSRDGIWYGYELAEEAHWPKVTNGVYRFVNRHHNAVNEADDTNLLAEYSFNFSIAVYDFDTETLYYFEFDT